MFGTAQKQISDLVSEPTWQDTQRPIFYIHNIEVIQIYIPAELATDPRRRVTKHMYTMKHRNIKISLR